MPAHVCVSVADRSNITKMTYEGKVFIIHIAGTEVRPSDDTL